MGRAINQSLMLPAFKEITSAPGSPRLLAKVKFRVGGNIYTPLKVTRLIIKSDYANNYSDDFFIHVIIPQGDLMRFFTPYQDSIEVTISVKEISDAYTEMEDIDELTRTYRAYIEEHVKSPIESSNDFGQSDDETANRSDLKLVTFRLEEVGLEQLRYMRVGTTARGTVPIQLAVGLLARNAQAIQLEEGEKVTGPSYEKKYNSAPRGYITIPDGTPLLDVPDLIQNEGGGIYSEALGFYVQNNHISLWRLYGLDRLNDAERILRVYVSPDPKTKAIDRTWRTNPDSPTTTEIWVAGDINYRDESMGVIAQKGTGVRTVRGASLMNGFSATENNTVKVDAKANNVQFSEQKLANGRANVATIDPTHNAYVAASALAAGNGAFVYVTWRYSLPTLITPGMAVELIYDYMGEIRNVEGTLLEATSSIEVEGSGMLTTGYRSATVLKLFVPRLDELAQEWVEDGAPGAIEQPQIK